MTSIDKTDKLVSSEAESQISDSDISWLSITDISYLVFSGSYLCQSWYSRRFDLGGDSLAGSADDRQLE